MCSRVWCTTANGKVDVISLTADKLEESLNALRVGFFPHENVCRATEVAKNPGAIKELECLCTDVAKEGCSVIAIDKETGRVVGVAFNKLQAINNNSLFTYEEYMINCKEEPSRAVIQFMLDMDNHANLFEHCKIDCLLEIMFLGVDPYFVKKGIGKALCMASIELAKNLKDGKNVKVPMNEKLLILEPRPHIVTAAFTSFISQRIGKLLGFQKVVEIDYKHFSYKGVNYKISIGSHTPNTTLEYYEL